MLGFIGVCGAREPEVDVETFLAGRLLELSEEILAESAATVGEVTPEVQRRTATFMKRAPDELP